MKAFSLTIGALPFVCSKPSGIKHQDEKQEQVQENRENCVLILFRNDRERLTNHFRPALCRHLQLFRNSPEQLIVLMRQIVVVSPVPM